MYLAVKNLEVAMGMACPDPHSLKLWLGRLKGRVTSGISY